jgi:hypothetical protein
MKQKYDYTKRAMENIIQSLERKYNPENDTIPNTPSVTFTDYQLIEMMGALLSVIEDLQSQIDVLKLEVL